MSIYNYRSSIYSILKNTFIFVTNNFLKKTNSEINFLDTIFVKKFFTDFYFLFFNPQNMDFYFLEKISFIHNSENVNSLITDLEYLNDFDLLYKIARKDKIKHRGILYSDEILPFGRISDISSISFKTYISDVVQISDFVFPEKSFSLEISFVLFFSDILNNKFFINLISPPVYIFLKNFIYRILFDAGYSELVLDLKNFYTKLFLRLVSKNSPGDNSIGIKDSELEKYILGFLRRIIFLILLNGIENLEIVGYENKFNFTISKFNVFRELKFKIVKFLKYDFWEFHKLSFYNFISFPGDEIKNNLISAISSKYSDFKNLEVCIKLKNSSVGRESIKMFLKNSFVYFLFRYFFDITLLSEDISQITRIYGNVNSIGSISRRLYYIYKQWNKFISELNIEFETESDYVKNILDKLYNFISDEYSKIYGKLNAKCISTYPVFNPSVLIFYLKNQFIPSFYSYLMRDIFFNGI